MTRDDITRMAREAGVLSGYESELFQRFAALVAAAERDRTSRLVADMQSELQTLRDRLAKQKPRIWVYRDNPGLTTMREPGNSDLWEPLGNIV